MTSLRAAYCFYCGAETLGSDYLGDKEVGLCDQPQCARELRYANQGIDEEAQERAREDNYDRYR